VPRKSPAELTPGWPDSPSADEVAEVARRIALVVRLETERHGLRGLAKLLGVSHAMLVSVSEGRTWPNVALVVRLERVLKRRVWPNTTSGS
jgi:ribosome-binding protein aMBF1 (putative translation factor)